uniref:Pp38 splice variant A n=1 Tax=Gallid alphaherpesvirus 2 TaxID=10390 RepID=Q6DTM2_9ALPH|nr:pp38 splice variant A [Gallid alphaherpesvirus 2]
MEFEAEHEGLTASWVAPAPQGGKGAEGRAGVADEAGHGKTEAECAEDGEKCGDAEMSALDRVQRDRWRFSSPPPHSGVTGKGAIPIKGDGKAIECQELTGEGEWLSQWEELPPEPRRSGNEHLDESRHCRWGSGFWGGGIWRNKI